MRANHLKPETDDTSAERETRPEMNQLNTTYRLLTITDSEQESLEIALQEYLDDFQPSGMALDDADRRLLRDLRAVLKRLRAMTGGQPKGASQ